MTPFEAVTLALVIVCTPSLLVMTWFTFKDERRSQDDDIRAHCSVCPMPLACVTCETCSFHCEWSQEIPADVA